MKKVLIFSLLFCLSSLQLSSQCTGVFLNEIHYDDSMGDVMEFVEVAVDNSVTISLDTFTVTLYNGSNGTEYNSETLNNFVVGMNDGTYTYYTWEPTSIQNGGPDGFALSTTNTTCEFLSYEGSFTATNGPFNMLVSTDIMVSENNSSNVGESLQLIGSTWQGPFTDTAGDTNAAPMCEITNVATANEACQGLDFVFEVSFSVGGGSGMYQVIDASNGNAVLASGTSSPITVTIAGNTSTTPFDINVWDENDNACIGMAVTVTPTDCTVCSIGNVSISNEGCVGADYVFSVNFSPNNGNGNYDIIDTTNGNTVIGTGVSSPITVTLANNTSTTAFDIVVQDQVDMTCTSATLNVVPTDCSIVTDCGSIFLNEIHYNNSGTDVNEFIEVAVLNTSTVDLTTVTVHLYNGNGGAEYNSETLNNLTLGMNDGTYTYYTWALSSIQNGPDGFALSIAGTPCELLSYGSTFTATNGPFLGILSTDIGVTENGAIGESLQLIGNTWTGPIPETPGDTNETPGCSINNVVVFNDECMGADYVFTVAFSPVSGSGLYQVIDATNGNAILASGTSSPITVTLTGNTSTTPFNITVWDQIDNTCIGNEIEITPINCSICSIVDVSIANAGCIGTDYIFDVLFTPSNGNGNYDIIDITNGNTVIGTGTASPITVTLTNNSNTTPFDIVVQDQVDMACTSASMTITPSDCTLVASCDGVFFNEIHYNNGGVDVGEFIEVAIANTSTVDLALATVTLYNGSNQLLYNSETMNNFTVGMNDGTNTYYTWYPSSIQNGPDAFGLSIGATTCELLSYGGTFTAGDGPFTGVTSVNIGATENGAIGESLQLFGTTWMGPFAETPGDTNVAPPCSIENVAVSNAGCVGLDYVFTVDFDVAMGSGMYQVIDATNGNAVLASGTSSPIIVTLTGNVSTTAFDINVWDENDNACIGMVVQVTPVSCGACTIDMVSISNDGCVGDDYVFDVNFSASDASGNYEVVDVTNGNTVLASGTTSPISITLTDNYSTTAFDIIVQDQMDPTCASTTVTVTPLECIPPPSCTGVFLNEIHYDNPGGDTGEFIEVAVENTATVDLSTFTVSLYDGSGLGTVYNSELLSNLVLGNDDGTYTYYTWPLTGVQNSTGDGFSLSTLDLGCELLSYEGTFTATDGPLNGVLSTDIMVEEPGTELMHSLQLVDGVWVGPIPQTVGDTNGADDCPPTHNLTGIESGIADYQTSGDITSDQMIEAGAEVLYNADTEIILNGPFEVAKGAIFDAIIDGCTN